MLLSPCWKRCIIVRHGEMCFKKTLLFSPPNRSISGPGKVGCAVAGILVSMGSCILASIYLFTTKHLPFPCNASTLEILTCLGWLLEDTLPFPLRFWRFLVLGQLVRHTTEHAKK